MCSCIFSLQMYVQNIQQIYSALLLYYFTRRCDLVACDIIALVGLSKCRYPRSTLRTNQDVRLIYSCHDRGEKYHTFYKIRTEPIVSKMIID